MPILRTITLLILTILSLSIFTADAWATPLETPTLAQESQLIVATKVPRGPFSEKDLKKYLSGQLPNWSNEEPVTIVLFPKESAELKWLCKSFLKIPPATYRRFLIQKAFRSGINIVEVQNQDEALSILKENSGAIAPLHDTHLSNDVHAITLK